MDGKHWIGCDGCQKWNHTDCEIAHGTNKEYREAAEDSQRKLELELAALNGASGTEGNPQNKIGEDEKSGAVAEAKPLDTSLSETELPYFCLLCRKSKVNNQKKPQPKSKAKKSIQKVKKCAQPEKKGSPKNRTSKDSSSGSDSEGKSKVDPAKKEQSSNKEPKGGKSGAVVP